MRALLEYLFLFCVFLFSIKTINSRRITLVHWTKLDISTAMHGEFISPSALMLNCYLVAVRTTVNGCYRYDYYPPLAETQEDTTETTTELRLRLPINQFCDLFSHLAAQTETCKQRQYINCCRSELKMHFWCAAVSSDTFAVGHFE